jgi:hypothetical protein
LNGGGGGGSYLASGFSNIITPTSNVGDGFVTITEVGPVTPAPEPSTLISGSLAGIVGLGLAWRSRRGRARG